MSNSKFIIMKLIKTIVVAAMLMLCNVAKAHDFVVAIEGQNVYFTIKSETKKTAEVTYRSSLADKNPSHFVGDLVIPAKVKHNDKVYDIVGVSTRAFSGANRLTSVTFPSSLEYIGDFAFEGCSSLSSVVFPGKNIKIGESAFMNCESIKAVSLGSDWKNINLAIFRWSKALQTINIPARVEKIHNLKSLPALKSIIVDPNNTHFASEDGVLYNKAKTILYGCPRAFCGNLTVAYGVETVTDGALQDCLGITGVDFPSTLKSISCKELSRMKYLDVIIMRSTSAVMTARKSNEGFMLLQVANQDVKIVVPSSAKKAYKIAMPDESSTYTDMLSGESYYVGRSQMPLAKNLKAVKSF